MSGDNKESFAKIVALNNDIARHAKRKELNEAIQLYNRAKESNLCNSHTYSAILNAMVRCGSSDKAQEIYDEIKDSRKKDIHVTSSSSNATKLRLDVILCTTMLKGHISEGNIEKGLTIFDDMSRFNIAPNIRTINTFLRGCVNVGHITMAEDMLMKMQEIYKVTPDVSTWEYCIALYCQGLNLEKAFPIFGRIKNDDTMLLGISNMALCMGRAAALLGDYNNATKYLNISKEYIGKEEEYDINNTINSINKDIGSSSSNKKSTVGGKRAWKESSDEVDSSRHQSLELFRTHKRSEITSDIATILAFIDKRKASTSKDASKNIVTVEKKVMQQVQYLLPFFYKVLLFSADTSFNSDNDKTVADEIYSSITNKFGLNTILKLLSTSINVKEKNKAKQQNVILSDIATSISTAFTDKIATFVDLYGYLKYDNIFSPYTSDGDPFDKSLPIKLEICSGGGEWAAAQAKHDKGKAYWMTMELRFDRVYQTFTKCVLDDIDNLCCIGGDAMFILPNRIAPASIDYVFVNHPEPPQQTGGGGDSQGKHLLMIDFFKQVSKILKVDGKITIVTDSLWYAKHLQKTIDEMLCHIPMKSAENLEKCEVYNNDGDTVLYTGKPPSDCGQVADASSYFDRLWIRDKKVERYFIVLVKTTTVTLKKRILSEPVMEKVEKWQKNKTVLHGKILPNQNKKIKFN